MDLNDIFQSIADPGVPTVSSSVTDEMYQQMIAKQDEPPRGGSMITNTEEGKALGEAQGRNVVMYTPAPAPEKRVEQPITDPYEMTFKSIKDFSSRIEASKDFGERNRLMMDMRQSAVGVLEDAHTKAVAEVQRSLNLDKLRQQSEYYNLQAQHNPAFAAQANILQQRLTAAEQKVDPMAAQILKANPRLQTLIKTVDGELAIHTKMTDAMWQRQQKNLDKEEAKKEASADILAGMDANVRSTLIKQFPGLSDDVALAKFVTKDGHAKDWLPILQGTITPDNYLTEALKGNKPAKMMAILEQQKRTGMSQEIVVADMKDAERFVQDPNFMFAEMAKHGLAKKDELDKMASKLKLEDSKSTREGLMKFAIGNVDTYLRKKNEDRIDSNLTAWPQLPGKVSLLSLPEAAATYKRLESTLGQAPNLPTFAKAFLKDAPDNEGRLQRQAMLTDAYTSVLSAYGNGVFHVPFSPGMIADKNRKLAVATAWEAARSPQQIGADVRSGKFFTDVMNSAYEGITSLQGIGGVGGGQGAETLDAFFKGLTGGK